MAIIDCPECGHKISDRAPFCIHCQQREDTSSPSVWSWRTFAEAHPRLVKMIPFGVLAILLLPIATHPNGLTVIAKMLGGLAILAGGVAIYFLPTVIAYRRKHHNRLPIFVVNLLLGLTGLGWIAALVWSLTAIVAVPPSVSSPETG